jgi:hypothetical protein
MKPRHIYDPAFVYIPAAETDLRRTFEIARCGEQACPSWWGCKQRGCYKLARDRYGESIVRFEPRPEHDQDTQGKKLKAGK